MFLMTSFLSHTWIKADIEGNSCIISFPNKMSRPAQRAHVFCLIYSFIFPGVDRELPHQEMQLREWHAPSFSCSNKGWWLGRHEVSYEEGTIAGKGSFRAAPPIPLPAAVAASESLGWQQQSYHFLVCWAKRKHSHRQQWTRLISQKYFRHIHSECTWVVSGGMVLWALDVPEFCIWHPLCPLRGSRSFGLVLATYKSHHTSGMSESLREPWRLLVPVWWCIQYEWSSAEW